MHFGDGDGRLNRLAETDFVRDQDAPRPFDDCESGFELIREQRDLRIECAGERSRPVRARQRTRRSRHRLLRTHVRDGSPGPCLRSIERHEERAGAIDVLDVEANDAPVPPGVTDSPLTVADADAAAREPMPGVERGGCVHAIRRSTRHADSKQADRRVTSDTR